MRILVTGANGQLGRELVRAFGSHETQPYSHSDLDITDSDAVALAVSSKPDVIVHAAALTDTTRCEREPDLASKVNAAGAQIVARAAAQAHAALVYVGTNEVFDGTKAEAYSEADIPRALNEYARTKLQGERNVQEALPEHYIVRTSWLYGEGGNNFVSKVLQWAETGNVSGVTDEIATPTWTRSLARAIARLVETKQYGVYHLPNTGEASRYFWATEVLRLTGRKDIDVRPLSTTEFRALLGPDELVPRKPAYSVLANNNARALGIEMLFWQEALARFLSDYRRS